MIATPGPPAELNVPPLPELDVPVAGNPPAAYMVVVEASHTVPVPP